MRRFFTIAFFVIIVLLFIFSLRWINDKNSYSFFVAGHIYGSPMMEDAKIHPPFKVFFPYLQKQRNMAFGILTGDVVKYPSIETYDALTAEMEELQLPYFVVPGNHDAEDRILFGSYFGDKDRENKTYTAFKNQDDLFILLDGTFDDENISGKQLEYLKSTLDKYVSESQNIFVFVHQLIWRNNQNEFNNIKTNWPLDVPDSNNYWNSVEPLLRLIGKPVYIFAGDLGANYLATPFMYFKKGNISYIAGGMGQKIDDNFVIVEVDEDGSVNLELVALQGDKDRFGDLEDYQLPDE